jgi:hypothetical protein
MSIRYDAIVTATKDVNGFGRRPGSTTAVTSLIASTISFSGNRFALGF